jgi:hypothetical protein
MNKSLPKSMIDKIGDSADWEQSLDQSDFIGRKFDLTN